MKDDTSMTSAVLVVDDNEADVDVLVATLGDRYEVSVALDGASAIENALEQPPDLILLDILMPGVDGYEVCRRLKDEPALRDVPVLFLSALSEPVSKLRGFELGGLDYITKPFDVHEVLARVSTHLELKRAREQLEAHHAELQCSYEQLREVEALRDALTHMIVHDMRSPLAGAMGYMEALQVDLDGKAEGVRTDFLEHAIDALRTLNNMMNGLLDVSRLESGEMPLNVRDCEMVGLCGEALADLGGLARRRSVRIEERPGGIPLRADADIVRRVLQNLLSNALRFSPENAEVVVSFDSDDRVASVHVTDCGPGIPAEYHAMIFEKFGQVAGRQRGEVHSVGLGLTFCKLAVEAHGGNIGVESEVGRGSTFTFSIPLRPAA